MKSWNDPETYRRMSEPYESVAEAEASLAAFFEDVRAAREKHCVRDVSIVWNFAIVTPEGEQDMAGHAHLGDTTHQVAMLAWALGRAEEAFAATSAAARRGRRK